MYVCMYVCTYVRMYVCTYVRMYVGMYVCTYVRMYVCTYVRMCVCMHVILHACLHTCHYITLHDIISHYLRFIALRCVALHVHLHIHVYVHVHYIAYSHAKTHIWLMIAELTMFLKTSFVDSLGGWRNLAWKPWFTTPPLTHQSCHFN